MAPRRAGSAGASAAWCVVVQAQPRAGWRLVRLVFWPCLLPSHLLARSRGDPHLVAVGELAHAHPSRPACPGIHRCQVGQVNGLLDIDDAGLAGAPGFEMTFADVDVLDQRGALVWIHLTHDTAFAALAAGEHDDLITLLDACKAH